MQTMGYVMGAGDEMSGEEGYPVQGGYVMGDGGFATVGRGRHPHHRGHHLALPPTPDWRRRDVAPGVPGPDEGLEPLPLRPDSLDGTWDAAHSTATITFLGRVQRPFRAERLLVRVGRFPDYVAGIPQQGVRTDTLFFGTTLGQAQRGDVDLELLGASNAFGVRMRQVPVAPGVDIEIPVRLFGPVLVGDQSINLSIIWMGRTIQ